jgi:hypothetical protein
MTTRTMSRAHLLQVVFPKSVYCPFNPLRISIDKVHPAHYGIKSLSRFYIRNLLQRIHDSCVGTSGNNYQAFRRFDKQRLIVQQWIGFQTAFVKEKLSTGIFKAIGTWYLAGEADSVKHLRCKFRPNNLPAMNSFSIAAGCK